MVFILCSKKLDEEMASISFASSYLSKFGFNAGCMVSVDISKGRIVITPLEDISNESIDNPCVEGG